MSDKGGELHTRLRSARESSGLKQAELAQLAGFAVNTLKQYESGRIKPGADALAGYARAGIDVMYLLTGEGTPVMGQRAQHTSSASPTGVIALEKGNERWEVSLAKATETLRALTLAIDQGTKELNLALPEAKKAELTKALFEEFMETGAMPRSTTIARFVRMAG
ncbi:MAG: helix-turn-helix domain-containing protein [Stenotrophobium sp.]